MGSSYRKYYVSISSQEPIGSLTTEEHYVYPNAHVPRAALYEQIAAQRHILINAPSHHAKQSVRQQLHGW